MSERALLDFELDAFWNGLVTGRAVDGVDAPERELVARLARLPMPEPRAGVLDALWTTIAQSEALPSGEPAISDPLPAMAPKVVVPMPMPAPVAARGRWVRVAAAIAALLAVAVVSGLLFAGRWRDADEATQGAQWTQSGGGPGKENVNPDSPAIADPSPIWQVETNGRIEGAPVVADGVVFIGNQEHHMYAFDAETGLTRWDVNLRKPITGTAAVGDGVVVVGTSAALFALDAESGATIWQRDDLVAVSDPMIAEGAIYLVDADNRLRSLILTTGDDRWTSDPFAGTPAFAIDARSERMYVSTLAGILRALSTSDGTQLWESDPGFGELGSPLVDGDIVALSIPGGVALVDGATGALVQQVIAGVETFGSVLALLDDLLIGGTDSVVYGYDSDSLQVQWISHQLAELTGEVTAGAGSIYLPGKDRSLTAIDPETGLVQWTLSLDEVAQIAPAVTSDRLFIATRAGTVYAIGHSASGVVAAPVLSPVDEDPVLADPIWKSTGGPHALGNPTGVAVAPTGEVWVCDTAHDRLQVFNADGRFLREFGAHGSEPGQFDFGEETAEMDGHLPFGNACSLAFNDSGALYVADAANARVQRFPQEVLQLVVQACCDLRVDGTLLPYPAGGGLPDLIIGRQGTGEGEFLFPSDVAVGPNGDLYVGDRQRLDVQRFDADGQFIETIGKPLMAASDNDSNIMSGIDEKVVADPFEPGTFLSIDGIAVDAQGRLYIVDDEPQEVDRLELDGTWKTLKLTREDYRINGIAVDEFGNVFIAQINSAGGSFSIYDPMGTLLGRVGTYGIGLGQFDATSGIALDGLGNAYATDWAGNRFQKFALDYEQIEMNAAETDQ